jgi:elongation factor G
MKDVPLDSVRNVVVVGHAASGKTSLVEALLHTAGMTSRLGAIDTKNTISDASPEEQERQLSIHGSNLLLTYRGHNVFLGDTPGYADFYGEVVAAVSIADAAIVTIDALHGVEVGTQTLWELLTLHNIPRMLVITKADKDNATYQETLDAVVAAFGSGCVPLVAPLGTAAGFRGAVELLPNQAGEADPALFNAWYTKLVDAVAETDDALMEKYLAGAQMSAAEMLPALRAAVNACRVFPVVICASTKELGIDRVLGAIVDVLPSPKERGPVAVAEGEALKPDAALPAAARVFKTVTDPFVGQITYFRVYQGTISSGSEVHNSSRNHKERLGDLLIIQGKDQLHVDKATPGDVVAVTKLKNTHVNDTLGAARVTFTPIQFPRPVLTLAVQSAKQGDEEKLAEGLHRVRDEDPTIIVERHVETHDLLVSGLGDVHLDVVFKRLKEKFKVEVVTTLPKVAYHETIRSTADVRYRHKKQSGGSGQFGEVAIRIRPNERDKGYEFVDKIVGGVISNSYIPSVDKGIRSRISGGVIAGCPVVDIVVELYDGKEHPVDSKDIAFQIAGKKAFGQAFEKAQPVLLEPIMHVEIVCPQEYMGDINGILNGKRGHITGMDTRGTLQVIKANVPHAEMFKFCGELRSITGGRGSFTMERAHYAEVPHAMAQQVIAAYQKSRTHEED